MKYRSNLASEYQEQCALFEWAEKSQSTYPQLANMFATLNGIRLPIGLAVKAKKQGNRKGVPDVLLDFPVGVYNGLRIEMKVGKNKQTREQIEWANRLKASGYYVGVCYGWEEAKTLIINYLRGNLVK